jgi:iron complex outermembrane receptor protein
MKKTTLLLLSFTLTLYPTQKSIQLEEIEVTDTLKHEAFKNVNSEQIKSADLAEALFKTSPSVSLVRRSGIANDIRIRGQRKDNINVTIDNAKVCGACPNRMDPPISHILTNNIDHIEITEGPYNVEEFGSLSADIKVHTKKPAKALQGEINLGSGSFGYKKGAFDISGGTETLRFLLSASTEKGKPYKDGEGHTFSEQINREIEANRAPAGVQYKESDLEAFQKKTLMGKLFWDITPNQSLQLSYTANRSDNILYPSTKMDALYDDSDIYTATYTLQNLSTYAKTLTLSLYQSEVDHPMSTKYRKMSTTNGTVTSALTTKMQGAKLKNSFDIANHTLTMGLDMSKRQWDGSYFKNGNLFPKTKRYSIQDVHTDNKALFMKDTITYEKLTVDMGLRYDITEITTARLAQPKNRYNELGGYLKATYTPHTNRNYFIGLGKSSRVPDGKELYFRDPMGNTIGTPTLTNPINYEVDIGFETQTNTTFFKAKAIYSYIKEYIAFNASNKKENTKGELVPFHAYENVDATLYGIDISGLYSLNEALYFEGGVVYQKGKKETPLSGQKGTNLPDIPPLKATMAINYDYDASLNLKAEYITATAWETFDQENGEQHLDAYKVVNLKATQTWGKNLEFTLGIDNLFDETYTLSNTYKDLTLITLPNSDVMLMNEPGRTLYANLRYTF